MAAAGQNNRFPNASGKAVIFGPGNRKIYSEISGYMPALATQPDDVPGTIIYFFYIIRFQ